MYSIGHWLMWRCRPQWTLMLLSYSIALGPSVCPSARQPFIRSFAIHSFNRSLCFTSSIYKVNTVEAKTMRKCWWSIVYCIVFAHFSAVRCSPLLLLMLLFTFFDDFAIRINVRMNAADSFDNCQKELFIIHGYHWNRWMEFGLSPSGRINSYHLFPFRLLIVSLFT